MFEICYELLFYFLTIQFNLPIDWHHHISVGLLITGFIKVVLEVFSITYFFLSWAGNGWVLTAKHIIKRTGVINTKEEVFQYDNIRSISVQQSFLGKAFRYGDIAINITASGEYHKDIFLQQIDNPYKYEALLKTLF